MSFATPEPELPPQQKNIVTEDIFHDSVSFLKTIPTPSKTSSENTSDTENQSHIQSTKEGIAGMENHIQGRSQQLALVSKLILQEQVDSDIKKMEAELTLIIFPLLVGDNDLDSISRSISPYPEPPTTPVFGTSNDGHRTEPTLKRQAEEDELAQSTLQPRKRSQSEDVHESTLKRNFGENEVIEPIPKRTKRSQPEEHVDGHDLLTESLPHRSTPSPESKATPVFEIFKKDSAAQPTLKRKVDNEEEVLKSIAKRKVGDEEQGAETALKPSECSKQNTEHALEPKAGKDKVPKRPLNKQQRKALKRKEEREELERRAKEAKKQQTKSVTKYKEPTETKIPSKPQSLRRLPAEIREMIFELCDFQWTGRSPALIRALRQDPPLHAEAMRVFFKQDLMFSLNRRNNWSFREMPVETILTIKKIKIEIQEYRKNPKFSKRKHQPKMIQVPHFTKMKHVCAWPIKVQEVVIEGAFDKVSSLILRNFEHYLAGFQQRLKKITLDLCFTRNAPQHEQVVKMTDRVNDLLRVEWHQNMVSGSLRRAGRVRRLVWCLEAPAEEGKYLKRIAL